MGKSTGHLAECTKRDFSRASEAGKTSGVFKILKSFLHHNRVGDILVLTGKITPAQLGQVLREERSSRTCKNELGQALIDRGMITAKELRFALFKQKFIRTAIATCAVFISLSGGAVKTAKASGIKDVPGKIRIVKASAKSKVEGSFGGYPALFGHGEKRSTELTAFTKWSDMFKRFENVLANGSGDNEVSKLQNDLRGLENASLVEKVVAVNKMMNKVPYITDSNNWGKTDYWATPVEFMQRGGDCEDFAIAKYTALRMLGVPEERLRVAIVQDTYKGIPHAVLIAYTDKGPMLLDNQMDDAVFTDSTRRYKPIYSINRQAWWLHKGLAPTRVASLN
ncbi:MAG: transglutaminase-like cysteine peptidase [Alphaproteobacteria bacterium]